MATPQVLLIRIAHAHQSTALPLIRQTLDAVGRGRTWEFKQFADLLDPELRPWRLSALLFTALGVLALVIAGVGIYGTVAYATTQRTREIGVRRALGAEHLHIMRLVVSQAFAPVVAGGVLGVGVATISGHLVTSMLYDVAPADPVALVGAGGALALIALVACVVPASQALRVDPTIALADQ